MSSRNYLLAGLVVVIWGVNFDSTFEPYDVLVTVIALSMAWSPASTLFTATHEDPEADHVRRRSVLRTLVRRAFAGAAAGSAEESGAKRDASTH